MYIYLHYLSCLNSFSCLRYLQFSQLVPPLSFLLALPPSIRCRSALLSSLLQLSFFFSRESHFKLLSPLLSLYISPSLSHICFLSPFSCQLFTLPLSFPFFLLLFFVVFSLSFCPVSVLSSFLIFPGSLFSLLVLPPALTLALLRLISLSLLWLSPCPSLPLSLSLSLLLSLSPFPPFLPPTLPSRPPSPSPPPSLPSPPLASGHESQVRLCC